MSWMFAACLQARRAKRDDFCPRTVSIRSGAASELNIHAAALGGEGFVAWVHASPLVPLDHGGFVSRRLLDRFRRGFEDLLLPARRALYKAVVGPYGHESTGPVPR